jgi:hypothetical protein
MTSLTPVPHGDRASGQRHEREHATGSDAGDEHE